MPEDGGFRNQPSEWRRLLDVAYMARDKARAEAEAERRAREHEQELEAERERAAAYSQAQGSGGSTQQTGLAAVSGAEAANFTEGFPSWLTP